LGLRGRVRVRVRLKLGVRVRVYPLTLTLDPLTTQVRAPSGIVALDLMLLRANRLGAGIRG